MVASALPLLTSHSLTVWSSLPVARYLPSAEKATQRTGFSCPRSVAFSFPTSASQSLTSLVARAVASRIRGNQTHDNQDRDDGKQARARHGRLLRGEG